MCTVSCFITSCIKKYLSFFRLDYGWTAAPMAQYLFILYSHFLSTQLSRFIIAICCFVNIFNQDYILCHFIISELSQLGIKTFSFSLRSLVIHQLMNQLMVNGNVRKIWRIWIFKSLDNPLQLVLLSRAFGTDRKN